MPDHRSHPRAPHPWTAPPEGPEVGVAEAAPLRRPFSLLATFLGWGVASFFSFVFTTVSILVVGLAFAGDGVATLAELGAYGWAAGMATLASVFLAYLLGGYAAGRMAGWNGGWHGAVVPLWTLLFGGLTFLLAYLGALETNVGFRVYAPAEAQATALGFAALLLVLGLMVGASVLGGHWGDHHIRGLLASRAGRAPLRGRPL